MEGLLLFNEFPGFNRLPWMRIGRFPTPLKRLRALEREIGYGQLWMKREDLCDHQFGGNKVRKAEFILADLLSKGKDKIITAGGFGSNYVLAMSIYGRRYGITNHAILFPQPFTRLTARNLALNNYFGTRMYYCPSPLLAPAYVLDRFFAYGGISSRSKVAIGPPGGSSPLSSLGYIDAMLEIYHQVNKGMMPVPDYIYVPLGSNGTYAALLLGVKILGLPTKVIGVRIIDYAVGNRLSVWLLIQGILRLFKQHGHPLPPKIVTMRDILILHRYIGKGYGCYTDGCIETMRRVKRAEGIQLEGVYTAKAFHGMLDFIAKNYHSIQEGKVHLFVNSFNSVDLTSCALEGYDADALPAKIARLAAQVSTEQIKAPYYE